MLAARADGKNLVAGSASPAPSTRGDFYMLRLSESGDLDPSFNGRGDVTLALAGSEVSAVTVAPDGRIYLVGRRTVSPYRLVAARYWP
ncbi:hypothetical protein AKJ09_08244 [Labilithrix luteola]|uniref:Uncharacterized protein n=1 Tax=Labilithrix luteola TaxID=1391654 RepID=A0A0K1Q6X1_9BACT|nr:hypothetical protein [Labilithrix luteola]AKV01581.1 hypothetical protein AKJ09_08244 [Labilithrix luteola]